MNSEQEQSLGEEICLEVESHAIDSEKKALFNRVLDRIEDFEATLELEHDGCGKDTWGSIKRILYKVGRAAIYCTRKGLGYLIAFIKICKRWIKKADLLNRMKNAWEGLTRRHPEEVFAEVTS